MPRLGRAQRQVPLQWQGATGGSTLSPSSASGATTSLTAILKKLIHLAASAATPHATTQTATLTRRRGFIATKANGKTTSSSSKLVESMFLHSNTPAKGKATTTKANLDTHWTFHAGVAHGKTTAFLLPDKFNVGKSSGGHEWFETFRWASGPPGYRHKYNRPGRGPRR